MEEVMRETEEEKVAALIATDTMEKVVGDIRLADDAYSAALQEERRRGGSGASGLAGRRVPAPKRGGRGGPS